MNANQHAEASDKVTCVICNLVIDRARSSNRAGWPICSHHRFVVKAVKYKSRCHNCLGAIKPGEACLLVREYESWVILHANTRCGKTELNRGQETSGPYSTLHLLTTAPIEVVKAAYKALAFLHHPDRGGDETKMKAINDALDLIVRGDKR